MRSRQIWVVAALGLITLNAKREFSQLAPAAPRPAITIAPEKLDFPAQAVDSAAATQTLSLTNTGDAPLRVTGILISGIDFTASDTCKDSLPIGGNCAIQVTFKPASTGPRLGALRISSSHTGGVRTIPLNGVGQ